MGAGGEKIANDQLPIINCQWGQSCKGAGWMGMVFSAVLFATLQSCRFLVDYCQDGSEDVVSCYRSAKAACTGSLWNQFFGSLFILLIRILEFFCQQFFLKPDPVKDNRDEE